jgi:hypothetical protein
MMARFRFTDRLMQPLDPPAKPERAREVHTHIYLDANAGAAGEGGTVAGLPPAKRSQTTAPPSAGFGDQEEGSGRQLLCRLMQVGEDWQAVDGEGNELSVSHGSDGALEVHMAHDPDAETGDGDPKKLGIMRLPGSAADALRKWQRDGRGDVQLEYLANRARADAVSAYWQERRSRKAN